MTIRQCAIRVATLALGCAMFSAAQARDNVYWSLGVNAAPGVSIGVGNVVPAPVYVQPAPVYVRPQPVYVQPAPIYVQPAPVYSQPHVIYPPYAYQPQAVYGVQYIRPHQHWRGHGHRGHGRGHRH